MKDDLINRQAAIDVIDAVFPVDPMKSEYAQGIACGAALAKTYVEQLPSAQKKGHWNFVGDNLFKCTCCGKMYTTQQLNGLRVYDKDPYCPFFCPHCGADMRGEDDG